jgi:histidinol dehydrogenase
MLPRAEVDVDAVLHQVTPVIDAVRARGVEAVLEFTERFDGVRPAGIRVPPSVLQAELEQLDPAVRVALEESIARVRRAHSDQQRTETVTQVVPGGTVTQRWTPVARVGLYAPGGLAVYPSTVVMNVVPAQVAGVTSLVVCSPPRAGSGDRGGRPHPTVLAAAAQLGIDEVWAVGGPHAVAALAYIHRVDKIVGPGNAYVNEAKLLVSRDVAIDLPAGPSEVVVVLGNGGDRRVAELELAAQQEHGPDSVCVLIEAGDLDEALAEVEERAPEHVVLLGDAEALAPRIRNAGAVFVGASSPVATGDYATGGNHVLPTNRWARSTGGLGLETFLKPVTTQRLTSEGLARVRPTVEALAKTEGMTAHAAAVRR